MKKSGIISCILLLTAFFSAGTTNAQSIVLTPKWTAQAQFAGYYVAEKMGFYKEEGLDVRIQHPSLSESSFSFLKKGKAQAVVMNLSYALTEFFAGARVVNILQTSQENSLMLVSHSPLKGLTALQHQKIAVWNHLSQELLGQVANKYQLQVEWIRFNGGVNISLKGRGYLSGRKLQRIPPIGGMRYENRFYPRHAFCRLRIQPARRWPLRYRGILREVSGSRTKIGKSQYAWLGMGQ